MTAPVLVFDSGLGGLTVLREIQKLMPDAPTVFAADNAAFPYGRLDDATLSARILTVLDRLIAEVAPAVVVIACNTASTLVLPALRARHGIPFVGTVPAVKPAAAATKSGLVSVLATPATVQRDYTADLIRTFAGSCAVTLVGAPDLATLAETYLRDGAVAEAAVGAEIVPAFVAEGDRRTDIVVLACTHFPLLLPVYERIAPWPVTWLDPAPAIARRVTAVRGQAAAAGAPPSHRAPLTADGEPGTALGPVFAGFSIAEIEVLPMRFDAPAAI